MIIDAFIYHNEEEILEIRFATLYDIVDRFVIVEGDRTHAGEPKVPLFWQNIDRFEKYLDKVTHVIVNEWPEEKGSVYDKAWDRERWQRDAIMHGLTDCSDDDVIIIGDADEIASPEAIAAYQLSDGIVRLKQRMFYYYLNCENKQGWDWQKVASYADVKRLTPCGIRYPPAGELKLVEEGGWHFSFCGDAAHISQKLSDYSHREYDTPEINDVEVIAHKVERGEDIFGRNLKYEFVQIADGEDDGFPDYVSQHYYELVEKGLIRHVVEPSMLIDLPATVLDFKQPDSLARKKHWSVTAEVCTKDRYQTTLPLTLSAIINQTCKPDRLVIYDDSEQRLEPEQLCETSPYNGLFKLATDKGIAWVINTTPRKGQVANHQHALDTAETDFIWRVDDDEIPEPNCLEVLLNTVRDYGQGGEFERIGAVGGLVHHPGTVSPLPKGVDGSLNDIAKGLNLAWFDWNSGPKECEHLYSTFMYRTSFAKEVGGYPSDLSPAGHREESWLTNKLHRAGYKVICTPHTRTAHLREAQGGIRSFTDTSFWDNDEAKWQQYLQAIGKVGPQSKMMVIDAGLGDHLVAKAVLPEIRKRNGNQHLVMAVCYPSVFEQEPNVTLISIADAKMMVGNNYDRHSLYAWMWEHNWDAPLADAMIKFWG